MGAFPLYTCEKRGDITRNIVTRETPLRHEHRYLRLGVLAVFFGPVVLHANVRLLDGCIELITHSLQRKNTCRWVGNYAQRTQRQATTNVQGQRT